jgi:hypothetical protein
MKRKNNILAYSFLLILIIALLGFVIFFFLNKGSVSIPTKQASAMKTYTNTKDGYQISYPDTLAIRKFGSGAGFRPANKPEDPQYEVIVVNTLNRSGNYSATPFPEYVRVAAPHEIQNYESLNSIEEIKTTSGEVGYETTWLVAPMVRLNDDGTIANKDNKPSASFPITYFDLPKSNPPATVQVTLSEEAYRSQYEQMLPTFTLVK